MSTEKAIKNAVASVKMEGYRIDNECVLWCKKLLEKEIDMEQYIALVKQKSGADTDKLMVATIRASNGVDTYLKEALGEIIKPVKL